MYLCVRPIFRYFKIFSATRRDIDLKLIQDTYRVVLDPLKKLTFIGQGHRDGTLLFEGTAISQKLNHRKISIFFHMVRLGYVVLAKTSQSLPGSLSRRVSGHTEYPGAAC